MYVYAEQKTNLFTDEGQRIFLAIRDGVKNKLEISGAITMDKCMSLPAGIGAASSWEMMACADRMVELGELREITTSGAAQNRIFVSG